MKITSLSAQVHNPDRVNVSIDGKYRLSLDVSQIAELGVKTGRELSEDELVELEQESQFGKLYGRALEYALMRPRSVREMKDYLYRKTLTRKKRVESRELRVEKKQKIIEISGYSPTLATRVLDKLQQKDYVNDEKFARWWIESRNQTKGTSLRKLRAELMAKGVHATIIDEVVAESQRSDDDEIMKIISKKRARYSDEQKFIQYLARQGFGYDDIKQALSRNE